jgi:hypothetical protein
LSQTQVILLYTRLSATYTLVLCPCHFSTYWRTNSALQLEMMRRLGSGVLPKTFPGTHTRLKVWLASLTAQFLLFQWLLVLQISTNNFEGSPLAACQEPKRRFIPSKW